MSIYDQSYLGQFKQAKSAFQTASDAGDEAGMADAKSGMFSSAAGGVMAGLGGATTLLNNFQQLSQIADTSQQQGMIDDIYNLGRNDYSNYWQIQNDFNQLNYKPNLDWDEIRGGSKGERAGLVAESTLSGAMTGLQIGGPWGAVAGAGVGLASGIGGWISGDRAADQEMTRLKTQTYLANDEAIKNMNARLEKFGNYQFKSGLYKNLSAEGGPVRRRQQTIQEFADQVLRRQRTNDVSHSANFVREYTDGGVRIKFRR